MYRWWMRWGKGWLMNQVWDVRVRWYLAMQPGSYEQRSKSGWFQ